MTNKKGFTLTEILLAVMIVGIIGIALASLTTAASREGGVGRSRVMLRNNLSRAMRTLRQDVQSASRVLYVHGNIGSVGTADIPLLVLAKNTTLSGEAILPGEDQEYITYCFRPGTITTVVGGGAVVPSGAKDGGTIYRSVSTTEPTWNSIVPACPASAQVFLNHVKFIAPSTTDNYPVPKFWVPGYETSSYSVKNTSDTAITSGRNLGAQLSVNLILELSSSPVVNDVTEEVFVLPVGFVDPRI